MVNQANSKGASASGEPSGEQGGRKGVEFGIARSVDRTTINCYNPDYRTCVRVTGPHLTR